MVWCDISETVGMKWLGKHYPNLESLRGETLILKIQLIELLWVREREEGLKCGNDKPTLQNERAWETVQTHKAVSTLQNCKQQKGGK